MKNQMRIAGLSLALCVAVIAACSESEPPATPAAVEKPAQAANVDDARLLAAGEDAANWLSYGRTYDEQRFSPLVAVSDGNVGTLGPQA